MSVKYFLYALLAVSIWAGNTIVSKMSAGAIPPGVISFGRWLIAFILLTPFTLKSVILHREVIRGHVWKLGALGLLGMAICQGVGYYAAEYTSATNMAILLSLVPLFTLLFSALFSRSLPSGMAMSGALISLLGIFIVLGKGNPISLLSQGVGTGDGLMVFVVIALALYGIFLKKWSGPIPAFTSLYVQIAWALVFLLPGFLVEKAVPFTAPNLSMVLYAAIPGSIIAPFVWMLAVQHFGAPRISIFMNLIPVITALIAVIFLNEHLQAFHFIGGGLTILGIILSQIKNVKKNPERLATVK